MNCFEKVRAAGKQQHPAHGVNGLIGLFLANDAVHANRIESARTYHYVKAVVDNVLAQDGPIHMPDRNVGECFIQSREDSTAALCGCGKRNRRDAYKNGDPVRESIHDNLLLSVGLEPPDASTELDRGKRLSLRFALVQANERL